MIRSMILMPTNGRDQPAEAVDLDVAAQHLRWRCSACSARRAGPAGSAPTMISALKMTADRIADCGECSRMMLSLSRPL